MKEFNCLVVNAGSSSLKFSLYKGNDLHVVASGICEKISVDGLFNIKVNGKKEPELKVDFPTHKEATNFLLEKLIKDKLISSFSDLDVIAHRIVHGGDSYPKSVLLKEKDIKKIFDLGKFAPLHNPSAVLAIRAFQKACKTKHVAIFDTSFHQTIPRLNYEYALPKKWRKQYGIRKYGMHGTSYKYITSQMKTHLKKKKVNLIICHLGNGASVCAVKNNESFNTSMGLTPLAGLVMGTRSGDVDPSIFSYIERKEKISAQEIENILNKESGVKALSGSSDMRDVEEKILKGSEDAKFALDLWSKRIADYVSIYINDLEAKVDGIVFTAGIGENSNFCRKLVIQKLKGQGLKLDNRANNKRGLDFNVISKDDSRYKVFVVPTNEELMMVLDAKELIGGNK